MTAYFAYGSNLSKAAMHGRAPGARPLIAGLLPDHRLTFESNEPPGVPTAYFANVRPKLGASVPGALYEVDAADLARLDAYEELARGVYVRLALPIVCADGTRVEAVVYRMPVGDRAAREGLPSRRQLEQIRSGYADWGLDLRVLDSALRRRIPSIKS